MIENNIIKPKAKLGLSAFLDLLANGEMILKSKIKSY